MEQLLVLLPWAFSAGVIATFNPCGFAMLPACLSYYVSGAAEASTGRNLRGGVRVGLAMTTGVLSVFLVGGAALSALGAEIARYLPAVNLAIGSRSLAASGRHAMQDPKDTVAALGAVVLAAACCLLPLLILGGLGVAGGIAWGRVGLIFAGAAVLVLVLVRAAAVALRRRKNWVMTRNKRVPRWGTDHREDSFQDRSA